MLGDLARNSFEFFFCGQQPRQTNSEQGSAKCSGSMVIASTTAVRYAKLSRLLPSLARSRRQLARNHNHTVGASTSRDAYGLAFASFRVPPCCPGWGDCL